MMNWADLFILYDTVQYDNNGWRNRNRVLVNGLPKWLTLAISRVELPDQLADRIINRVRLRDNQQFENHLRLLQTYYKSSPYLDSIYRIYPACLSDYSHLSASIERQTRLIASELCIDTTIISASEVSVHEYPLACSDECHTSDRNYSSLIINRNKKLINLLLSVGCTEYISGMAAKSYIIPSMFAEHGIRLFWNRYSESTNPVLSIVHHILAEGPQAVLGSI